MSEIFNHVRLGTFLTAFIFSVIILGISAHFGAAFLPLHQSFIVFSIVASGLTMITLVVLFQRSQPRWDLLVIFCLAVIWLAMGGYSTDVVGQTDCDQLQGRIPAGGNKSYSAKGYCQQSKVIQAFSWANFALFAIMFWTWLNLVLRAAARGYKKIWAVDVRDLPWFDEYSGAQMGYGPVPQNGASYTYPTVTSFGNSQPVFQLPGHSVVITQGPHGQHITQVPVAQAPTPVSIPHTQV